MTRRLNFLLTLSFMVLMSTMMFAQPDATLPASEDGIMQVTEENKGKWPERPKDMWELGVHVGHSVGGGDVAVSIPAGFGAGFHVRKALNYTLSLRGGYTFHNFRGANYYRSSIVDPAVGTVLVPAGKTDYVHAYKTALHDINVEMLVNLSNLKFHKSSSKWGIYAGAGVSYIRFNTDLDLLDGNNAAYDWSSIPTIPDASNRDNVSNILDGTYETDAVSNYGDVDVDRGLGFTAVLGASYKISNQLNLSIENKSLFTGLDMMDGRQFYAVGVNSGNGDAVNYTNVRLNFNLGNPKKQAEPLYWLNPLDAPYDMIANNTQRLDNLGDLLADKDGDGVPDKLDKEQNSPAGAIVNTKGETLDSDGDGVPDYLDKEPYTEPGAAVDGNGVNTAVEPDFVTMDELKKMESDNDWINKDQPVQEARPSASSWFLPMIHFDNGSSTIKPTYYAQLNHVAIVMKKNGSVNVVVEGHASSTASVATNNRLSYNRAKNAIDYLVNNYGISRSRLTLRYQGETKPLGGAAGTSYINRRVEFRVNDGSETGMSSPQ